VLVAFGVNDTTAFHSVARWRKDLCQLLKVLDTRCGPRLIVLSGVPPMQHFPALPQPLRLVLGLKSKVLDAAAREFETSHPRITYVPLPTDMVNVELMASDGYHPSAKGCALWAEILAKHSIDDAMWTI
jgi:lysophospholipase L1-like esterase